MLNFNSSCEDKSKSPFFLIELASSEVWMVLGGLPDDIKIVTNNKVHDDDEV